MIRHVLQKHLRGCGHAAIAMITGETYDDVVAAWPHVNPEERGLYTQSVELHLTEQGYALQRLFANDPQRGPGASCVPRPSWPPGPFAEVHLCNVMVGEESPYSHFVVMLRDGSVLDPLSETPKRLTDYHRVYSVAGVHRVWGLVSPRPKAAAGQESGPPGR